MDEQNVTFQTRCGLGLAYASDPPVTPFSCRSDDEIDSGFFFQTCSNTFHMNYIRASTAPLGLFTIVQYLFNFIHNLLANQTG